MDALRSLPCQPGEVTETRRALASVKIKLEKVHRDELKRLSFERWDTDSDGFLCNPELRVFATTVLGFHSTEVEWDKEYRQFCFEKKCDPNRGVPQVTIMQLLDDPTSAGCYCTDSELEEILGMDDQSLEQEARPGDGSMLMASRSSARDAGFVTDEERTVYFAGANYQTGEATLQKIFEKGGTIEDMTLFCLEDGRSRGMGLVRYSSAEEAQSVIATVQGRIVDGYTLFVTAADASLVAGGGASKGGCSKGRGASSRNLGPGNGARSWDSGPDDWGRDRGGQWSDDYDTSCDKQGHRRSGSQRGGDCDTSCDNQGHHGHGSQRGDGNDTSYDNQGHHSDGSQGGDGRTVFFTGVPLNTSGEYLLNRFRTVSGVQAFWLFAHRDGRSKGSGVVQYRTEQEAWAAIKTLSGVTINGCEMSVTMDKVGQIRGKTSEHQLARRPLIGKGRSAVKGGSGSGGGCGQATICQSSRLFFAGAPFQAPDGVLRASFEEYGPVHHWAVFRLQDGRSRGMGICTFADSKTAGMALEGGVQIDGWDLVLQEDEQQFVGRLPQEHALAPYGPSPWAGGGKGGGSQSSRCSPYGGRTQRPAAPSLDGRLGVDPRKSVFFTNAPFEAEEATIQEIFQEIGRIKTCTLFRNMATWQSRGMGVVEYYNTAAAARAYNHLHGYLLDGRKLIVDEYRQ